MNDEEIKARIRRKREDAGLSQDQVAKKLGKSRNAYRNIECGPTNIKIELLREIAKTLGCSVEDLLGGYDLSAVKEQPLSDSAMEYKKEVVSLTSKLDEAAKLIASLQDKNDFSEEVIEMQREKIKRLESQIKVQNDPQTGTENNGKS